MSAFFRVHLNLSHACTIAGRLENLLVRRIDPLDRAHQEMMGVLGRIIELLHPFAESEEMPEREQVVGIVEESANLGRALVDAIERLNLGDDRVGQWVRNYFECLELGEEGARLSLRAGENPDSALRPT